MCVIRSAARSEVSGTDVVEPAARAREPEPSVTLLQCELRHLFLIEPIHRAVGVALRRIGEHLEASYAVVHARYGIHA